MIFLCASRLPCYTIILINEEAIQLNGLNERQFIKRKTCGRFDIVSSSHFVAKFVMKFVCKQNLPITAVTSDNFEFQKPAYDNMSTNVMCYRL